jgi:hypothetical protein
MKSEPISLCVVKACIHSMAYLALSENALELEQLALTVVPCTTMTIANRTPDKGEVACLVRGAAGHDTSLVRHFDERQGWRHALRSSWL